MEFDLTPEENALRESVSSFATSVLADGALDRARSDSYPRDVARRLADQGLLGLTLPEEVGGQGGSLVDAVIAIQSVAASCPRSADVVQAGNFGAIRTLAEYAEPELRDRYLPPLLQGNALISLAMTEPEAGSAVTDLSTQARLEAESVVLNGTKIFSTHSAEADFYLVYVRFGPGTDGIGSVIVERDSPGLTVGSPSTFVSGERWSQLYFEDCRVPAANVLLGPGGFRRQMSSFNVERIGNAARSIALGRFAFDTARDYAKVRQQFGRPLMDFQGIQWQFAEMSLKLESAQLLLMKAAVEGAHGLPSAQATAMAKLAANSAGFEVANQAMQVMGGMGYSTESLVHYCFLRTRGWQIAGGSTEMLKQRIAEGVFGTRFDQRVRSRA